jgi:hypothetical protein
MTHEATGLAVLSGITGPVNGSFPTAVKALLRHIPEE